MGDRAWLTSGSGATGCGRLGRWRKARNLRFHPLELASLIAIRVGRKSLHLCPDCPLAVAGIRMVRKKLGGCEPPVSFSKNRAICTGSYPAST